MPVVGTPPSADLEFAALDQPQHGLLHRRSGHVAASGLPTADSLFIPFVKKTDAETSHVNIIVGSGDDLSDRVIDTQTDITLAGEIGAADRAERQPAEFACGLGEPRLTATAMTDELEHLVRT